MTLTNSTLERLVASLLIGFLIGLERERAEVRKARRLLGGVRTFPLIGLAGAASILLADLAGPWLVAAAFLAVAGVVLVSYMRSAQTGDVGATTEIAALGTFLLGALAGSGRILPAAAAGVLVALLLVAKVRLESFSRALQESEILAALELAVITIIVLPILPNRGFGPWQALNPFQIWVVVVLVSALSFAGFVAARIFGRKRGVLWSAVFGALVSSTAVTVSLASRAREDRSIEGFAAAATILASTIMCVRVVILVSVAGPHLLGVLLPMAGAMVLVGAIAWWVLSRRSSAPKEDGPGELSSPLHLRAALLFGLLYAAVLLAVRGAQLYLGSSGVLAAASLSGVVDVDAISIALARSSSDAGQAKVAAAGIAAAMVTNTLVKLGIGVSMGRGSYGRRVAIGLGLMAVAGVLAAAGVWMSWK